MKLSNVMIGSENPKKLQEFYSKFLDKPVWEEGEWLAYDLGGAALVIGPHSEVKGQSETPGRIIFAFETEDVKAEFGRIKGVGAAVIAEPYNPGESPKMMLATFADPDGNYFQLASPWDQ